MKIPPVKGLLLDLNSKDGKLLNEAHSANI